MSTVFVSPVVSAQRDLLAPLIASPLRGSVISFLKEVGELLYQAFKNHDARVVTNISNWHPDYLGGSTEKLMGAPLTRDDFRLIVAREYGWGQWTDISESSTFFDAFEDALELFLAGELELLHKQLRKNPGLTRMGSSFGHQAGLLHYAGSNGIETWRQVVPLNLPSLVHLLRSEFGADTQVTLSVYGGQFTPLQLAETSAHPHEAGIMPSLRESLQ